MGKSLTEIQALPRPVLLWHFANAQKAEDSRRKEVRQIVDWFTQLIRPDVWEKIQNAEELEKNPVEEFSEDDFHALAAQITAVNKHGATVRPMFKPRPPDPRTSNPVQVENLNG